MIKENKKIIIFAAGTGGHIYPGLSIANFLKSKKYICFYGLAQKMVWKKDCGVLRNTN